jgi:uncharacterized protein YbaR (Trm112 family)
MPRPVKRSDVVEIRSQVALEYVVIGVVVFLLGLLLYAYRDAALIVIQHKGGMLESVGTGFLRTPAIVLMILGALSVLYGLSRAWTVREVPAFPVACPYCEYKNLLTAVPDTDFACTNCHRLIPIADGLPMPVFQVRCGYCNELNYYNAKTEVLICEKCDREIPIAQEEGKPQKHISRGLVVQDDPNLYDLVLVDTGPKTEELIPVLQSMLALNRAQVKQVMDGLPAVLLTGITYKKAQLLQAQLAVHEARAEFDVTAE